MRSSPSSAFLLTGPATTEIYTLSLHDALPIFRIVSASIMTITLDRSVVQTFQDVADAMADREKVINEARAYASKDRKSTRLNSSHTVISYAVFCVKKKTDDAYTASS